MGIIYLNIYPVYFRHGKIEGDGVYVEVKDINTREDTEVEDLEK